jgi:radical SAM superfamily enzyme YgiQ (UPF0313 family)
MKIMFVNPTLGGDFSALDISICNLATYLNERSDHKATICDMTFHRKKWQSHLRHSIAKDKPDIVGISCNSLYMNYIKKIMTEVKQEFKLPVVVGGYHPSIHPEDTFSIPEVDALCSGDGEYALAEYLSRLEKGKSAEGIGGIWAKENGVEVRNPRGNFITNIDDMPIPDWGLWEDLKKYFYFLGMGYFIGTRGCPYNCTNCDALAIKQHVTGPYYRVRDPVKYVEEIQHQWEKHGKKKGMRLAQLFDQVLTLDGKWLNAFCNAYIESGLAGELPWSTFARIDNLDTEKMKILGKSNCAILRVGVEAGDEFIRNKVHKKGVSNEQINEIMKAGEENGVGFTIFFMLGGPGESRETINKTIDMAVKLQRPKRRIAFFVYKPFTEEGVKLIKEYGGSIDEGRWAAADNITFNAVVNLKDVTPADVEWLQKKAYIATFGRRWLRMIKDQYFLKYALNFSTYMLKGMKYGLDKNYLIPYYHIYGYENVKQ